MQSLAQCKDCKLRVTLTRFVHRLAEHVETFDDDDPEHETRLILQDLQSQLELTLITED